MSDSLIIGEQIELIGAGGAALDPNGTPSTNPLCAGAVFRLIAPTAARGGTTWDLGAPQPTTDIVGSLLLDGERPYGYRASNRKITLPIIIKAPTFQALVAAREVLLKEVNEQTWTLRWTRDTLGALAGNTVALPLLFDCFRASPSVYEWGGFYNRIPYGIITLSFEALPYARNDQPQVVDFQSPLAGRKPPPPPVTLDSFSSVSGTQWAPNAQAPDGTQSAFWDPGISPALVPPGQAGLAAVYSKAGLALNLAQGWTGIVQGTGTTTSATFLQSDAAPIQIGDRFQLAANALNANDAGLEGGTTGNWFNYSNVTLSNSVTQAHSGTHSLALTSTWTSGGALDMIAGLNIGGGCLPNDNIYVSAWFRSAVTARVCAVGCAFYDAANNFLSQSFTGVLGTAPTDSTSAWVQATAQIFAPANAASYQVLARVAATATTSELHYLDDIYAASRGSALLQTQIFTITSIAPPGLGFVSVGFSPAAATAPVLGNILIQTGPPQLNALTFWAGFGSTLFWKQWARLGGRATFAFTLTDTYGTVLPFARTVKVTGTNQSGTPKWHRIRVPIPYNPAFDYANVTAYSLTITNRGTGDLRWTQQYISSLQAVPPPTSAIPQIRGAVYDLAGMQGSARAPVSLQFQQSGTSSVARWFNTPGTFYWTAPPGVSTVGVFNIGGGGGGVLFSSTFGSGGGGGGGSANNGAVAVTPGNIYKIVVGTGGLQVIHGAFATTINGADSTFTGDSVTVTAHGGTTATTAAGAAGGAAGTGGFAGGTGGAGVSSGTGGGGGGGGSGGSAAGGNVGNSASGTTGGLANSAVVFGGPGGRGGNNSMAGSTPPNFGGGAGGPGANGGGGFSGVQGAPGLVVLTYTIPKPFQTLLVHRPPPAAPESLSPVQPVNAGDPSDGSVVYTLNSIGSALNARFGGTYTVYVSANSWASPASARTITVTITQWEQGGGASYPTTVSASITPNNLVTTSGTSATHGPIVNLGNVTLPIQDMPPDNTDSYFTVSITSGQTTDSFTDILFIDTMGSTVLIQSPTAYSQYFIDEPSVERDIGMVLGTVYDRGDAISVLDRAAVTGGPLSIYSEGNPYLLAYCAEGAPQVQMHYFPRWYLDRYQ